MTEATLVPMSSDETNAKVMDLLAEGKTPVQVGNELHLAPMDIPRTINNALNSITLSDLTNQAKITVFSFKKFMDEQLSLRKESDEPLSPSQMKSYIDLFKTASKMITDLVSTQSDMETKYFNMQRQDMMNVVSEAFKEAVRDEPNAEDISKRFIMAMERRQRKNAS
jgi:hypothetical protein